MDFFDWLTPPGMPGRAGDPGLLGWSTFGAYLCVALLCWLTARAAKHRPKACETAQIWFALALGLLLLGLNKQMDLQTWVIWIGEQISRQLNIYDQRRLIQAVFFFILSLAGIGVLTLGICYLKGQWVRHSLVLLGAAGLAVFVILRVGNFNHVLAPLWRVIPFQTRHDPAHFLELFSVALIGLGALQALITCLKVQPQPDG